MPHVGQQDGGQYAVPEAGQRRAVGSQRVHRSSLTSCWERSHRGRASCARGQWPANSLPGGAAGHASWHVPMTLSVASGCARLGSQRELSPAAAGPMPQRCRRVLDVGCGAGAFTAQLAERSEQVDALDRCAEMIAEAKQRTPGNATVLSLTFWPGLCPARSTTRSSRSARCTNAIDGFAARACGCPAARRGPRCYCPAATGPAP
jgi:SAM-dependent methyltransferase